MVASLATKRPGQLAHYVLLICCQYEKNAHFVISPLENPYGNALFLRLILENSHHMHHSTRYTAFGNDLQNTPDSAPMEREIRIEGRKCSGAKLLSISMVNQAMNGSGRF